VTPQPRLTSAASRSRRGGWHVAILAGILVAACSAPQTGDEVGAGADAAGDPEVPFELVIEGARPLISDVDIDLSLPAAIDVDADGNLWIADRTLHHVLVVNEEGELLRTIGRNGAGPGEFRGPRGLGIRGDHAYVLDNVHGVQSFDMQGEYVAEYPAPRIAFDFDFTGDGGLVTSTFRVWPRGALVMALGPDGEELALFGELPFEGAEDFNFRELRESFLAGALLDVARNGALPTVAPDGSLWVAFHTEQRLRR